MGVDAQIYFKAEDVDLTDFKKWLPNTYELDTVEDADVYGPEDATHILISVDRYYDKGYERGDWPRICKVLTKLHSLKGVTKVWYSGDNTEYPPECSPQRVLEISSHFKKHGNKPYRSQKSRW